MLQVQIAGYVGADAEIKSDNGREFTTFRVAHSDRWTDAQGQTHDNTQWIDCILNGHPAVADYLKAGTLVYCSGHCRLRCYSSEKARGFVAGMSISVVNIELLGGKTDAVPNRLYDAGGRMIDVKKFYFADAAGQILTNGRGKEFAVDDNGWVFPMEQAQAMMKAEDEAKAQAEAQQAQKEPEKKTKQEKK